MPKKSQAVKLRVIDTYGSCVVNYLPDGRIEIRLPCANHVVVVGPIRSRKSTGIVIVNSQGAETSIPLYDGNAVAQTRDGLEMAAVFVPIVAADANNDQNRG